MVPYHVDLVGFIFLELQVIVQSRILSCTEKLDIKWNQDESLVTSVELNLCWIYVESCILLRIFSESVHLLEVEYFRKKYGENPRSDIMGIDGCALFVLIYIVVSRLHLITLDGWLEMRRVILAKSKQKFEDNRPNTEMSYRWYT